MEVSPKSFPLLSYVLSRISPNLPIIGRVSSIASSEHDLEQPPHFKLIHKDAPEIQLIEQMPQLQDPDILAAMKSAVADVSQIRSVLQILGERPDHEAVDQARDQIAEIDARLSKHLEEIVLAPRPQGVNHLIWRSQQSEKEKQCRNAAEREKSLCKAIVQLDEMHDAYEKLLKDAEERLMRIYRSSEGSDSDINQSTEEEVNTDVVGILQQAMTNCNEAIDLSGRQLTLLPEAFGHLQGLVVLNLSNNQLQVLPDSIGGLRALTELHVASNRLVSLPDSIGLLFNLKIIDISGNRLTVLPDSICYCRSLVELDASYNELTYLPTNIGHELVNLEKLIVHLNKLRSLPSSIGGMSSLRYLDAHFNELRSIPPSIGKLTGLQKLDLSSNFSDLQKFPETIGDLVNLEELDLSNNQIRALPVTLGKLENLSKLNLDQNPLEDPSPEIVQRGVESVKEYLSKKWLDALVDEEQRSMQETHVSSRNWISRSTLWLDSFVSGFSVSVSEYLGGGRPKDPCLDQQL